MAVMAQIVPDLGKCQPLFREFCKINRLDEGDLFKAADYIVWVDGLSLEQSMDIIRKYRPDFKMKNCNL